MDNPAFSGRLIDGLVSTVERSEQRTPMTDVEFEESMDSLIFKGLIEIGINAHGEIGFVPTELGREVFREIEKESSLQ